MEKVWKQKKRLLWPKEYHIIRQTWWRQCYGVGIGSGSPVFIDDVAADWRSAFNSEEFSQNVQNPWEGVFSGCLPEMCCKKQPKISKAKKCNAVRRPIQSPDLNSGAIFLLNTFNQALNSALATLRFLYFLLGTSHKSNKLNSRVSIV